MAVVFSRVAASRATDGPRPAAVRVEGGSFGFQIGGSETDVMMLVMNQNGGERLLSSKFTLGADASVAAGPVGRTAAADTDAYMTAEILSYSRARGDCSRAWPFRSDAAAGHGRQ